MRVTTAYLVSRITRPNSLSGRPRIEHVAAYDDLDRAERHAEELDYEDMARSVSGAVYPVDYYTEGDTE